MLDGNLGTTGIAGETVKITGELQTNATNTSSVGTYDINQGTIALANNGTFKAENYYIVFTKGTLTINKANLETPAISIDTDGNIVWNNITGATGYEISFDNINWENATSSSKKIDLNSAGTKTAYLRAISTNANYNSPSNIVNKSVTVVSLAINKGTGINSIIGAGNYVSGKTLTIEAIVSPGYSWDKWIVTNGNVPTDLNAQRTTITITQNTELQTTATLDKYNVVYNANGGNGEMASGIAMYNENFSVATNKFTRTGYTFKEWNEKPDGTGTVWNAGETKKYMYTKNITLYAQWKSDTKPDITLSEISNDWTNEDILVIITATDTKSGIKTVTVNETNIKEVNGAYPCRILTNGTYRVVATNNDGIEETKQFAVTTIDKDLPIITGVENSKKYTEAVKPIITDDLSGIKNVQLLKDGNKVEYKNGDIISDSAQYKLLVADNAGNTRTIEFSIVKNDVINFGDYEIKIAMNETYIMKVNPETKTSDFIHNIKNIGEYKIIRNNTEIYSSENTHEEKIVSTGDKLVIGDAIYTIVVSGDVNCDGKIDSSDLLLMLRDMYALSENKHSEWILNGAKFLAGDIKKNGAVDSIDILSLLRYIVAKSDSEMASKHSNWLNLNRNN